jgi:methylated-DNA-[protein]-cysteine S-methyltransferase
MENGLIYETPLGKIGITENGKAITGLHFGETLAAGINGRETVLLNTAYQELLEYLRGQRKAFDLPLAPRGTAFQKKVWQELLKIPYGKVCSYQDIAAALGNEKAARAVGSANHNNPIAIFIPCHRVIGSNGKLTGYAGGIDIKEKLLEHEKMNDC